MAPWPSLARACPAAGKASPSPAFGKLFCALQGPSPRSPPLGSLPKARRPRLGLLSTPAAWRVGEGSLSSSGLHSAGGLGSDVPSCSSPLGTAGFQLPLGTSNGHSGPRRLLLVPSSSCRSGLRGSARCRPLAQALLLVILSVFSSTPRALYRTPIFSLGAALKGDAPSWHLYWGPCLSFQGPGRRPIFGGCVP